MLLPPICDNPSYAPASPIPILSIIIKFVDEEGLPENDLFYQKVPPGLFASKKVKSAKRVSPVHKQFEQILNSVKLDTMVLVITKG